MKIKDEQFYKSVKDFLENYLIKQQGYSKNTQRAYKIAFSQLLDYFDQELSIPYQDVGFDSLTYVNICGFLAWLEREHKCAIQTVNQRLMAIRSFAKYTSITDPAKIYVQVGIDNVPRKKQPTKIVGHLSETALNVLFEQPSISKLNGRRDRFFMLLMYDSAARCHELLNLKVGDVTLGRNAAIMLNRKGGKQQSVPLSEDISAQFDEYLKAFHHDQNPDDFVFYSVIHGERHPLSPDAVAAFMRKYASTGREKCTEIPLRMHPHLLRHSRAMHLYRSGMPLVLISEFLGHSDVNTTRIYAWSDTEMKRQAIKKAKPQTAPEVKPIWDGNKNMIKRLYGIL